MLVLQFANDALFRDCCEQTQMVRRWGDRRAWLLSRRLQQLEAMISLEDLEFMPFDFEERPDGVIEIAVDERTSLFVKRVDQEEDRAMHATLMISAVAARSTTV